MNGKGTLHFKRYWSIAMKPIDHIIYDTKIIWCDTYNLQSLHIGAITTDSMKAGFYCACTVMTFSAG